MNGYRMNQHDRQRRQKRTKPDGRMSFDLALEIPAPAEAVFAYLSDLENNPHWNWAVAATTALDDRLGGGSRYLQERVWPRPRGDILEITAYEPPRLLEVVAGESDDGPVRYRYRLAAKGSASTRLEARVELEPSDPKRRPDMYTARIGAAIAANLENLRNVLIEAQIREVVADPR